MLALSLRRYRKEERKIYKLKDQFWLKCHVVIYYCQQSYLPSNLLFQCARWTVIRRTVPVMWRRRCNWWPGIILLIDITSSHRRCWSAAAAERRMTRGGGLRGRPLRTVGSAGQWGVKRGRTRRDWTVTAPHHQVAWSPSAASTCYSLLMDPYSNHVLVPLSDLRINTSWYSSRGEE